MIASKFSGLIAVGLLIVVGCNSPKSDAGRGASEKWAEPKQLEDPDEKDDEAGPKVAKADEKGAAEAAHDEAAEEAGAAEAGAAEAAVAEAGAAEAGAAEAGAAEAGAAEAGAAEAGAAEAGEAEGGAAEGGEAEGGAAPTIPAGDAGPAYFAIDEKGVFSLESGTLTQIKKAPDRLVTQLSIGPDGKAYLLGMDGVMRIEGDTAKLVAKTSFKKTGNVESFAATADGHVWTAAFKGVGHWDGKAWTLEDKAKLGAEVKLLKGIAIDKDGRVWVASSNLLHVKDGETWTEVDVGKVAERKPFFDMLTADPKTGTIYAPASSVVVKAEGIDAVSELAVASEGLSSFGMIAFAQNGVGALKTDPKHVARFADGVTTRYELGKDFSGTRVHHLAVDGQGRVWVATDAGISVMGPAAERVEWKSGSIPEIAGKVQAMVVLGAGPELPEVGEVKKGTLKGKILIDGAPLASADLEMCPEPATLIKKSPCEDSPVRFSGQTKADGAFEFAEVPLGAYGIAVRIEDKWKTTLSGQYGAKMQPGETFDIGALKFKK